MDSGPFALIRSQNVHDFSFRWDGLAYIDEEQAGALDNVEVHSGDILVNITGDSVARVCMVDDRVLPARVNQHVAIVRANPAEFSQYYLLYALLEPSMKQRLLMLAGAGATRNALTKGILEELEIRQPSRHEQDQISGVLAALDTKIEHNRQMAATLEELSRALFKSWFVDFDPVRAKAEGRDTGLPADITALFPEGFNGEGLPTGWKQSTVGELFSIVAGNTPSTKQSEYWGGTRAWATPKDMSGLTGPLLTRTDRTLTEQGFTACSSGEIPAMSLLMSSRAPVGYLAFNALPVSINQGIAAFVAKALSPFYAWAWCHENMKLIKLNANGSTFEEISKGVLRTVAMVEPSKAVHDAFVEIAEAAFSRVVQLAEETENLICLRDQLLPKLLSGELRVADAETAIAAA